MKEQKIAKQYPRPTSISSFLFFLHLPYISSVQANQLLSALTFLHYISIKCFLLANETNNTQLYTRNTHSLEAVFVFMFVELSSVLFICNIISGLNIKFLYYNKYQLQNIYELSCIKER